MTQNVHVRIADGVQRRSTKGLLKLSFEEPWNIFMRNHGVFRYPIPREGESSFRRRVKARRRSERSIILFKKREQHM